MRADEVQAKHSRYLFQNTATYYEDPVVMTRGSGKYLYDLEDNQYLDFFGGILTVSIGHGQPDVARAVAAQAAELTHTSTLYMNEPLVKLAERLARMAPGRLEKSFFTNSGTEANETAVLLARIKTGAEDIIALRHSYHGRSALTMSMTGVGAYRHGPAMPGVRHAASPYCYRCPFGKEYPSCNLECAQDVEEVIKTTTSGEIAAFIAEPIQGVGGFITPPKEYFQEVARIVRRHGGLFIADEVQTAWGRTGEKMFGIEHWGVEPDIMTSAKGLANGIPIGWTIADPDVADAFAGATISTFGGNPVSSAAASATLDVIQRDGLVDKVDETGTRLRSGLEALQEKYPVIGDVRGMGLMQALELVADGKEPAPQAVNALFEATKRRGLLIGKGGSYGNAIRISPHMNVEHADIDEALSILDAAFAEIEPVVARTSA